MMKSLIYVSTLFPSASFAQLQQGVDGAQPRDSNSKSNVPTDLISQNGQVGLITEITSLLLFIAGAIAVIVIIYGGIRYVTSTGDATRVKQAKDTILYGIIGLVIAILAYSIVNFIIQNLK